MAVSERDPASEQEVPPAWADRRLALEEFLTLPDDGGPSLEFDDGVVTRKVAPKPLHGNLQVFLVEVIGPIVRRDRLGVLFSETRFVAPRWVPVPDIVFYSRETLQGARRPPADFSRAPDLAIEIASPGQRLAALMRRCVRFLERGSAAVVLVYPDDEAVFVFRPDQPPRILQGEERIDLDDVLPGFELAVDSLFRATNWDYLDDPSGARTAVDASGEASTDVTAE